MNLGEIKYAYFLGIGGIGMSAIARYFASTGIVVAGYDKTPSDLTAELENEGIAIHFNESTDNLPDFVSKFPDQTLLIYTPAIPKDHAQFIHLNEAGRRWYKRSEVLGIISRDAFCIAVAGTHGKTTTSTLIAHLLYECNINFTAFLGGISSNYNTNYIHKTDGRNLFPDKPVVVLEADEFDRSFHRLSPDIAVITAIDPDHLDIYGTPEEFHEAFNVFVSKIKAGGNLIYHKGLQIRFPENISASDYSTSEYSQISGQSIRINHGYFEFDYEADFADGSTTFTMDLKCGLPGLHNVENATAALGVCEHVLHLPMENLSQGLLNFRGVKRRFEYVLRNDKYVVIDDYAHHPQELSAIIGSVKLLYPNKKLTGVFQPHLFSRTRDFADGFAQSLSKLDELILMDIYPARELPIPGITSSWLLEQTSAPKKSLLNETQILEKLRNEKPELLLILGAGDIDRIVPKVKEVYSGF